MKGVLMIRALALEIAPIFTAAIISRQAPRFGPPAFIVAGSLILILIALCLRDGVVLASKAGVLHYRRKDPFMFWAGISVHFTVALYCFFVAGILMFRKS
jgi:hypothetical protein